MPTHDHPANYGSSGSNSAYYQYSGSSAGTNDAMIGDRGGSDGLYRPAACVGIIVSKDA